MQINKIIVIISLIILSFYATNLILNKEVNDNFEATSHSRHLYFMIKKYEEDKNEFPDSIKILIDYLNPNSEYDKVEKNILRNSVNGNLKLHQRRTDNLISTWVVKKKIIKLYKNGLIKVYERQK